MARFTVVGDYLYTVSYNNLTVISLADPSNPVIIKNSGISFPWGDIETIYPFEEFLLIGSRSALYIYDISIPSKPREVSRVQHFTSCDPVVASGEYAYVTLNGGRTCTAGSRNELIVYSIADIRSGKSPIELTSVTMTNPRGLGVDGAAARLFVCERGLEMYDISDPASLNYSNLIDTSTEVPGAQNMDAYDVIVLSEQATVIVVGSTGLYQFDYSTDKLILISYIPVVQDNE